MRLKTNPYHLLLLAALALILISFFINQNEVVDIHLHDTMFVISRRHVFWIIAFIVLTLWILYLLTRKILFSKFLTWMHVGVTLGSLLLLFVLANYADNTTKTQPLSNADISNWNLAAEYNKIMRLTTYCFVVLVFGQIIFVVNLLLGLLKKLRA